MAGIVTFSDPKHPMYAMVRARRLPRKSSIGARIRSVFDTSMLHGTLTGQCRNFLSTLNEPHELNAEAITDRLLDELRWELVQNVRRQRKCDVLREWIAEIVTQSIADDAAEQPAKVPATPDVSDVGTRLRSAIEADGQFVYKCGTCKTFLLALNRTTHHDVEKILDGLMLHGELPIAIRDKVGGTKEQRVWLRSIVERVIRGETQ